MYSEMCTSVYCALCTCLLSVRVLRGWCCFEMHSFISLYIPGTMVLGWTSSILLRAVVKYVLFTNNKKTYNFHKVQYIICFMSGLQ